MKQIHLNKKELIALASGVLVATCSTAQAGLAFTNGNFENDPVQTINVDSWFDTVTANVNNWWESTWAGPNVSPNGTSVLGLSYMFNNLNWAYQSIGVNDGGLTEFGFQYDVGSFTDAGGPRDLGLTFSIYQVDGTYAGGADNVDISGATGATLIDSVTVYSGPLDPGQMLTKQTAILDLTSADSVSELFFRVQNEVGTVGQPWVAVDNIMIPEPTTLALAGLGVAALLVSRRRRQA